jgi:hypothetical protein
MRLRADGNLIGGQRLWPGRVGGRTPLPLGGGGEADEGRQRDGRDDAQAHSHGPSLEEGPGGCAAYPAVFSR